MGRDDRRSARGAAIVGSCRTSGRRPVSHILVAGPIDTGVLRPWLGPVDDLPAGRGGTAVSRLVRGLLERGHRVTVATNDHGLRGAGDHVEARGDGLAVHFGPYRAGGRSRDAFAVERAFVADVVRRADADVVHAHWTYEEALGALAARPDTVVTVRDWGPAVLRHHRHPYRVVRLGMQVAALRRARRLTAPSPYMARRAGWVARRPVALVPNPVDAAAFAAAPRARSSGRLRLVAVNNGWGPNKNVGALLEAFTLLRRERPEATLALYGADHELDGPAHRWARGRGLDRAVAFHGRVEPAAVIEAMQGADVFVHPALGESFGNVLAEAMAAGTPVVAGADAGAVPWVVADGGELVDVRRPAAIAEAVLALGADEGRWARRSRAGWERATASFGLDAVTAAYERVYADADGVSS